MNDGGFDLLLGLAIGGEMGALFIYLFLPVLVLL